MGIEELLNTVRREVARLLSLQARDRIGIVDSYDPKSHSAKVRYQPDNSLSGWLPVGSAMSGNGYGVFFAPTPGDQVQVSFHDAVHEVGIIGMRLFSTADQPLDVPAGEMWAIHQSGSGWKFHNDGTGELITTSDLSVTVGGDLTGTVSGDANLDVSGTLTTSADQWNHTGDVAITGGLTTTEDVVAATVSLKNHLTTEVQPGSGVSGPPQT